MRKTALCVTGVALFVAGLMLGSLGTPAFAGVEINGRLS